MRWTVLVVLGALLVPVTALADVPSSSGAPGASAGRRGEVVVQSVSPSTGDVRGRTKVKVRGRGFTHRSVVYFGKERAVATTFRSSRLLVARSAREPDQTDRTVPVTVRSGSTLSTGRARFRYTIAKDVSGHTSGFVTSDGNVACDLVFDPPLGGYRARCEVRNGRYAVPTDPSCVASYGDVFALYAEGGKILCAGDTESFTYANTGYDNGVGTTWWDPFRQLRVTVPGDPSVYAGLKPGNSIYDGTLSCTATATAATCRDSATGHSMTISTAGYSLH